MLSKSETKKIREFLNKHYLELISTGNSTAKKQYLQWVKNGRPVSINEDFDLRK